VTESESLAGLLDTRKENVKLIATIVCPSLLVPKLVFVKLPLVMMNPAMSASGHRTVELA
jgi:hypothetical protein